jgi:hypothetical protein
MENEAAYDGLVALERERVALTLKNPQASGPRSLAVDYCSQNLGMTYPPAL